MSDTETLVLIDASGFIYRAYHAMPTLVRADGQETGGVLGYAAMLWNLLRSPPAPYTHIAAVFDVPRLPDSPPDWRRELHPGYKAGRGEKPQAIYSQIKIVREGTADFNVAVLGSPGVEADDIIATYARRAVSAGMDVIVVSHDKDLWQLIRPGVRVYNAQPHKRGNFYPPPHWITHEEVFDKFRVDNPALIPDVQGLTGDGVDGFKGIPNVGPKTAGPLIERYGSLESLLDNLDDMGGTAALRDSMRQHAEVARICKRLATLHAGVDIDVPMEELRARPPEHEAVIGFLDRMEIIELKARVIKEWAELPTWIAVANMQREVNA